ncbi:hypothetical protein EVAR_84341_1 [Eumeta japonica]|uniref:Uncharacterized protein n=1 Tax=Eumeta variegata TaxID=151549 RepID=A0A4C1U4N3_EUMVA|nr:hypothetical protein EVAR_84341_1 [Eumeta japonica]
MAAITGKETAKVALAGAGLESNYSHILALSDIYRLVGEARHARTAPANTYRATPKFGDSGGRSPREDSNDPLNGCRHPKRRVFSATAFLDVRNSWASNKIASDIEIDIENRTESGITIDSEIVRYKKIKNLLHDRVGEAVDKHYWQINTSEFKIENTFAAEGGSLALSTGPVVREPPDTAAYPDELGAGSSDTSHLTEYESDVTTPLLRFVQCECEFRRLLLSIRYPISIQEANNALATALRLRVSMDGGDDLLSGGSRGRVQLAH